MDTNAPGTKTLSYLNTKWWYRFIKVVFVIAFLLIAGISAFAAYYENSPKQVFDNEGSYVQCDDGRKLGLEENNVILYSSYMYDFEVDKFKKGCAYDPNDPININPDRPSDLVRLTPLAKNFKLVSIYKTKGSYMKACGTTALAIVIVLIVFEIMRRIFYYILLGSFLPKKK